MGGKVSFEVFEVSEKWSVKEAELSYNNSVRKVSHEVKAKGAAGMSDLFKIIGTPEAETWKLRLHFESDSGEFFELEMNQGDFKITRWAPGE